MILALTGSHGTGKTEVFNSLQEEIPSTHFFNEGVRHQMPSFGFNDPYELINEYGIGIFEALNINSWTVIDPNANTALIRGRDIVTDRCSVDNYAYYLTLLSRNSKAREKPLIKAMAAHYASLVDVFVYFPIRPGIPLEGDEMRPGDAAYQHAVDANIYTAFDELAVSPNKIHTLGSLALADRVSEIAAILKK